MSTAIINILPAQATVVADTVIDHLRVRVIDAAGRVYVETALSAIQLAFPDVAPGPASVLLELVSDRGIVVGISSRMIHVEPAGDESAPGTITADLPALSDMSFFEKQEEQRMWAARERADVS